MSKINHNLRSKDGGTIYHLPEADGQPEQGNLSLPNVFEESSDQRYPLGTKFVLGERVFRYFKASGAISYTLGGIASNQAILTDSGAVYGAHLAGVTKVKIDGTSDGVPAKNHYAGAHAFFYAADYPTMRVISSLAAEAASPYAVELTLEQALPYDIADNTVVYILPNRFASGIDCHAGAYNAMHAPVIGVPMVTMTDAYYGWVQTRGPRVLVAVGTVPGAVTGDRTVVFRSDGGVGMLDEAIGESINPQIAGYSLAVAGEGTIWIFLTLDD